MSSRRDERKIYDLARSYNATHTVKIHVQTRVSDNYAERTFEDAIKRYSALSSFAASMRLEAMIMIDACDKMEINSDDYVAVILHPDDLAVLDGEDHDEFEIMIFDQSDDARERAISVRTLDRSERASTIVAVAVDMLLTAQSQLII